MSRLLDPKFPYVPSHLTDVRITFDRVRREIEAKKRAQEQQGSQPPTRPVIRVVPK